ncbi:MAG TPA: HD-GYP domain-containing protein [Gemmataceae bacterium]|nr:HD-GYP domain-containing protein [Gemmataceae bacterium]
MLLTETPTKLSKGGAAPVERVQTFAASLREEFGTPFVFFDATTGGTIGGAGESNVRLHPSQVAALLADGKARAYAQSAGRYLLAVPIFESGQPTLIAGGELEGLAPTGTPEAERERGRLERWLQAAADRQRQADQLIDFRRDAESPSSNGATWEAILTLDHLVRRLRIHKEPAKNQQRILEGAFRLLRVQSLIWVPQQADAPILVQGDPLLAPPECRALAACMSQHPDYRPLEPLICNDLPAAGLAHRFPQLNNTLAFVLTDQGPVGWVIALNKKAADRRAAANASDGPATSAFRKSDAAILTPFVALLELHSRGSARYQDLKELLVGLTRSLTAALDAKDSYTYGHSERVARIAVELGRELGLLGDELSDIYLAGLLHDVGKIGIRDSVLGKVEPLTAEEFEHIKQHVTIGYAILSDLRPIRNLLPGVLYHHEHWDGKGYPDGLAGEAIPLLARILAVADAYDAMSTNRPYRDALPCRKVEEILTKGAGTQWDKRVIEAFQRCRHRIHTIRQRGVGDSLQMAIDGALRIDKSSLHDKIGETSGRE